jgi:predicted amidohydrolase
VGKKINVAAIQMNARVGDVQGNLNKAERLVEEAFSKGAQWAILPEFFSTAMAFHPSLLESSLPLEGPALAMLRRQAVKHNGYVGGSFIAVRGADRFNTFVLVFPDGNYATHDKDQPTMWENCYYISGKDDGILRTPIGPVGAAVCWEFVRSRTAKRLKGEIDLLVGGSCWWTTPDWPVLGSYWNYLNRKNVEVMVETPARMARLLGVPVVHSAHIADFTCNMPWMPGIPYSSYLLGETQIIDGHGGVLARMKREDGEGVITAEIELGQVTPTEEIPDRFWIPRMPIFFRLIWTYQNFHGKFYYKRMKAAGKLKL